MDKLFPIGFMDAPKVLDASVTGIPGAASLPLQIIADSGPKAAYAIEFTDSTGDYMGLYTGPVGSETLRCMIGGGAMYVRASVVIAAHSRVSIKSLQSASITNGNLTMSLMGMGWS